MIEYVPCTLAGEIEIAVMCEIYRGSFIGCRRIDDFELVIIGQQISYVRVEISGIVFFTVFAQIAELDSYGVILPDRYSVPDDFIKAL